MKGIYFPACKAQTIFKFCKCKLNDFISIFSLLYSTNVVRSKTMDSRLNIVTPVVYRIGVYLSGTSSPYPDMLVDNTQKSGRGFLIETSACPYILLTFLIDYFLYLIFLSHPGYVKLCEGRLCLSLCFTHTNIQIYTHQ